MDVSENTTTLADAASLVATAIVDTARPVPYMRQLCKHFGHKTNTAFDDTTGFIELAAGRCDLDAHAEDVLVLTATADDEERLATVQKVIGGHLERFGRRDEMVVNWTVTPGEDEDVVAVHAEGVGRHRIDTRLVCCQPGTQVEAPLVHRALDLAGLREQNPVVEPHLFMRADVADRVHTVTQARQQHLVLAVVDRVGPPSGRSCSAAIRTKPSVTPRP